MNMKLQVVSILIMLSVSGIGTALEVKASTPSLFCQGVMTAIGETPEQTIIKFGQPASREDKDMKSTHTEGVIDKVSILNYTGVRIGFLHSGKTASFILLGAELAVDKFSPALKTLIPPSHEAALAKLGTPEEEQDDPNVLRYFCTSDLNEWVDLLFDPTTHQITSMIFRSHID